MSGAERLKPRATLPDFSVPVVCDVLAAEAIDRITIRLPTEPSSHVVARATQHVLAGVGLETLVQRQVLVLFEKGDRKLPIIVGVIAASSTSAYLEAARPQTARIDGKRVVLDAAEEIVLQCGKGSLTLTADGRIVLKGTDIVSRALRTNKIKGGSVNIN